MKSKILIPIIVLMILLFSGGLYYFVRGSFTGSPQVPSTPTPAVTAEQLPEEKQPVVSLSFSSDAHYVTVNLSNLHADQLEYNLIYEAKVKNNQIQTGVNASTKLNGQTTFTQRQLLGSESSGKFTYHQDIKNAIMELALRDNQNRSVFTGVYPFTVSAGETIEPTAQ